MKKYLLLFLIFSKAHAIQFDCTRMDSGEARDSHFDMSRPVFQERFPNSKVLTLIDSSGACGKTFDYKAHCQTDLIHQGAEYSYSFRCDDVFGDLYFTGQNGGAAQFRCFGENVPPEYNDRIYRQCRVIEN